jgi:hypothetical protein
MMAIPIPAIKTKAETQFGPPNNHNYNTPAYQRMTVHA